MAGSRRSCHAQRDSITPRGDGHRWWQRSSARLGARRAPARIVHGRRRERGRASSWRRRSRIHRPERKSLDIIHPRVDSTLAGQLHHARREVDRHNLRIELIAYASSELAPAASDLQDAPGSCFTHGLESNVTSIRSRQSLVNRRSGTQPSLGRILASDDLRIAQDRAGRAAVRLTVVVLTHGSSLIGQRRCRSSSSNSVDVTGHPAGG